MNYFVSTTPLSFKVALRALIDRDAVDGSIVGIRPGENTAILVKMRAADDDADDSLVWIYPETGERLDEGANTILIEQYLGEWFIIYNDRRSGKRDRRRSF